MSRHSSPEYTAPDNIRCQALVKGQPSYHWEWVRTDHQCPRKANQSRGPYLACFQHARLKTFTPFDPQNVQENKT